MISPYCRAIYQWKVQDLCLQPLSFFNAEPQIKSRTSDTNSECTLDDGWNEIQPPPDIILHLSTLIRGLKF